MDLLEINSASHSEMIEVTRLVQTVVPQDLENGICHIFVRHTTCALTINENADCDVKTDMVKMFEQLVPWHQNFFRHFEGNSAAHVKSSLLGFSLTVPVIGGRLELGRWQGIYLCEFDGPKTRQLRVQFLRGASEE